MEKIYIKKVGEKKLKLPVQGKDFGEKLMSGVEYYDEDSRKLIAIVFKGLVNIQPLYEKLKSVSFAKSSRTSGLETMSHVFGTSHRDYLRNHPTRSSKFNFKHPDVYAELLRLMVVFEKKLLEYPEIHKEHEAYKDCIPKCWQIGNGLFSSGVINKNTKLLYHTDNGNAKGCYSFMIAIKKGISGGNLHLPEYGVELPLEDGDVLFFDGASVSHGVTPFVLSSNEAKRFTIVFYTNEKLKKAMPSMKEELDLMNKSITESILRRKRK